MKIHSLSSAARRAASAVTLTLSLALLALPGFAQNTGSWNNSASRSWIPYTSHGYWGVNVGQASFEDDNCFPGFGCDDSELAGKVYLGGMFNQFIGLEIAYVDMGKFERNGGDSKARGGNISLVGSLPLGDMFNVFAKGGATYGFTKTSAAFGSTGDENGWGGSYGAGFGVNLTPQAAILIEWDRHRFEFAGGDEDIDLLSVGLKYRF